MLLVLTPNPAIDRTLIVPGFRTTEVCRIAEAHNAAGGKGLNVVRTLRTLGIATRACGPLGGQAGQRLAALAAGEGMDAGWSWLAAGETRTCQIVVDPDMPATLVLNEHGPHVTAEDWQALAALVRAEAAQATCFASSGSLPPGVEVRWFVDLLNDLMARGLPVLLDTSGAPLVAALDLPVALLKINIHELGAALGQELVTPAETAAAAASLLSRGPHQVIVTLGKSGAIAVGPGGAWHAQSPPIRAISPTGSGDAVLAGAVAALLDGQDLSEALKLGVACGAANTLTIGGGIMRMDDVETLRAAAHLLKL